MSIKKIIVFGDFLFGSIPQPLKSAAVLRISYMLRKEGFEVKQVHHCTLFDMNEIETIIRNFSKNEPVVVCVSTSFLANLDKRDISENKKDVLDYWGEPSIKFLVSLGVVCKKLNITTFLGGWNVKNPLPKPFSIILNYYTHIISGNNVDNIISYCNGTKTPSQILESSKIIDFTDMASSVLPEDNIAKNEALITELAAGCIFSCSFCDYAALGKKKTEFVRSYDSLKREFINNYEKFGTRVYTLTDNIINDYYEKVQYLIKIREETGIDIRWVGYVRLDTIKNKEQVQLLKDSGMAGAIFGIESFKKETGPYIGKMTDKQKLINSLNVFRDTVGDTCITTGSFIAGLPTETPDELTTTFEWLNSIEGSNLLDTNFFTPLALYEDNENKNDINKSRNNPFKDYQKHVNGEIWVSPWGKFSDYKNLVVEFHNRKENKQSMRGGAFSLPMYHNCGFEIEQAIMSKRKNLPIVEGFRVNRSDFLSEYKSKILS
jgi:hypothetical protein